MTAARPFTPPRCDLRDFPRMSIDIPRLFSSGFNASASRAPLAWMVGHKLWYRSWHQVPAASLPDDDEELCHLAELGFDLRTFRKAKPLAMRGWLLCSDGRLYHPVVAAAALEAWLEKLNQRIKSGTGNAQRWNTPYDRAADEAEIAQALDCLRVLNPQSKAFARAGHRASLRAGTGTPKSVPDASHRHPTGTATGTPKDVPVHSLKRGRGRGRISSTEAKASGAEAPPMDGIDPAKQVFDLGVEVLTGGGVSERNARAQLGKWRQEFGDGVVLEVLLAARAGAKSDPNGWIEGCWRQRRVDVEGGVKLAGPRGMTPVRSPC